MLMFAYGSNLNVEAMKRRCPKARKLGAFHLTHSRLVFRGVADIEYDRREKCPGGLWRITKECEDSLDEYEGVEHGLYDKVYIRVRLVKTNKIANILVYQMKRGGYMPPDEYYLNTIAQGYRDFGLDLNYLDMALQRSWDDKEKTPFLRARHKRRGNRPLAHEVELGDGQ
jgi:gamma-glutamylcyclotransferase (GGCT)/AIG2-like uncharacterized protein YtfP